MEGAVTSFARVRVGEGRGWRTRSTLSLSLTSRTSVGVEGRNIKSGRSASRFLKPPCFVRFDVVEIVGVVKKRDKRRSLCVGGLFEMLS